MESLILTSLLEPLAKVYPRPKNLREMAARLASYCPSHAAEESLDAAARRMIETRRAKAFPSMAELIEVVRYLAPPRGPQMTSNGYKPDFDDLDRQAIQMLCGTVIASQAVKEGWAPGLLDFVRKNGRLPRGSEIADAEGVSRANDAKAVNFRGNLREAILKFRLAMHDYAERHLTGKAKQEAAE